MPESVVLNDGETSEFSLTNEAGGIVLRSHAYPPPRPLPVYASSVDTEGQLLVGEPSYENRTITAEVEVFGAQSEAVLANLQAVVALIGREGGTWTYTTPDGTVVVFDLVTWEGYEPTLDIAWTVAGRAMVSLAFTAKPFGRGAAETLADRTETSAPALIFTETSIDGDVPALARLVIDEDQGVDQGWMVWGVRSRNYSSAASAALLIQAEDLTTQGGSTKTAGASGASGSGSNVVRNTDLTTSFVSILSGQLSASSTYLSHVGTYRVFARVYCPTGNTGNVDVALEWSEGDFRRVTRNAIIRYESSWESSFRLIDFGIVNLPEALQGTQRWEPRIIARSTVVGDEIDVDYLMFVPVDEAAGEASQTDPEATPTAFVARDEFGQTAGNLNAKTLPVGGSWATSGSTTDLAVSGSGTVTRATTSDASPRFAIAGTTNYTNVGVRAQISWTSPAAGEVGVLARWTDSSNYLRAAFLPFSNFGGQVFVTKVVAGTPLTIGLDAEVSAPIGVAHSIELVVLANGKFSVRVNGTKIISGQDADLATGGVLATGEPGLYDFWFGSASTRTYDNFAAWVPPADAACFASQSMEVRWDGVIREDSAGAIWTPVSSYEGDLLKLPVTGPQNRTVQTIVKFSRNPPGQGADSGIDDLSARYTITPRYLTVPKA